MASFLGAPAAERAAGHVGDADADSALPNRWRGDFGLLWSGSAAAALGGVGVTITMPLLALSESGSALVTGLVLAAGALPSFLYLPAGVLVDRFDRWRTMTVSQILRLLVALAMIVVPFTDGLYIWILAGAAALSGACSTFYNIAETSAIPEIVPGSRLARAMAVNEMRGNMACLCGRPLSGALLGAGRTVPFIADAILSALALASVLAIRRPKERPARPRAARMRGLRRELAEGGRWLWRKRFLRRALITCTLTNMTFAIMILVLMVRARDHRYSPLWIGLILGAPAMGGFVASWCAAKPKLAWLRAFMPMPTEVSTARNNPLRVPAQPVSPYGRFWMWSYGRFSTWTYNRFWKWAGRRKLRTVWGCLSVWFVLTAIIPLATNPWILLGAWGGVGFVGTWMNVVLTSYQATRVPEELRGRVIGVIRFCTMGGTSLGTLLAGPLICWFGGTTVAWCAPAAIAALSVHFWLSRYRRYRRLKPRVSRFSHVEPSVAGVESASAVSAGEHEGGEAAQLGTKARLEPDGLVQAATTSDDLVGDGRFAEEPVGCVRHPVGVTDDRP
jgi:MFS family permease